METVEITIRRAGDGDASALAALHAEAWRHAYRGIIPGLTLERMVARRGPRWWQAALDRDRVLLLCLDDEVVGYASFGASRSGGRWGEIYEIYLKPACQGTGLGRRLFAAVRRAVARAGFRGTVVWALAENDAACRFYRAMGGEVSGTARQQLGGRTLGLVGYAWA